MSYKISSLPDLSGADSLMVAKIIDYPLEKTEYKPYAQGRLCLLPHGLSVQLWAFEASPSRHSCLQVVLQKGAIPLSATLWSSGRLEVMWKGSPCGSVCTLSPLWGEDQQGRFWGGSLVFDRAALEEAWGSQSLQPGSVLQGNLYKLSDDAQKPHRGSLFPADFAADPYGGGSLGRFEFVSY